MVLILSVSRTRRSHHRRHQLKPTIEALPIGTSGRRTHLPQFQLVAPCRHNRGRCEILRPQSSVERILVGCINCLLKCQIGLLCFFFWLLRLIYRRPKNEANSTNSWLIYIYIYIYVFLFVSLTFLIGILNWNVSSMDSEIIKSNCTSISGCVRILIGCLISAILPTCCSCIVSCSFSMAMLCSLFCRRPGFLMYSS